MKYKDISGQKFGRLTALHRLHNTKGKTKWLCVCDCGNIKEIMLTHLCSGATKSCGCYNKEQCKTKFTKHGKRYSRLWNIWEHIKQRCYNINNKDFNNYGARGIAVCDEWRDNFQAFYNWTINNGYKDNLTIDRINVNGNYEPNNCRWIPNEKQARNRRNNKNFTYCGEKHCLSEWCEILNLKRSTVSNRINVLGWSIEKALELEVK